MAEVRLLSGRKIDWNNPPRANAKCMWSRRDSDGDKVYGSFRSLCALNRANNLAIRKYDQQILVYQGAYSTRVAASAGTHDLDACYDLGKLGDSWWESQKFYRLCGIGGWYRKPPTFMNHYHGFVLPPHSGRVSDDYDEAGIKVGKYVDGGISTVGRLVTSSQLVDYYNHAFGLSGQHKPGSDRSWYPKNIPDTIFSLRAYIERRAA